MAENRLAAILERVLQGALPPNVALMQLLVEASSAGEAAEAIRRHPAGGPAERRRLADLSGLLARLPGSWGTIRAVMAEAVHDLGGSATGPDHWAKVFDRLAVVAPDAGVALYGLGSADLLAAATAEVVAALRARRLLGRRRRLLEIGCGVGRLTLALAPEMERAIGLDVSGAMLAEAARRASAHPNAFFVRSSGRDLAPVATASVDLVLAADLFPYLVLAGRDLAAVHVREAARVLRPGGALAILNYSYRGDPDRDRAETTAIFAQSGLEAQVIGARDLALWDAALYLARRPAGEPS